jgi:carboxyl-terminal processing protease
MRRCVIILISCFLCSYAGAQEIVDPSFSIRDTAANLITKGWTRNSVRCFYDTVNAHTAPGCIYIYNDDYRKSKCTQLIPFSPGKYGKYKLKLWVRTESRKGFANAYVKTTDARGISIYQNELPDNLLTGKKRWQQYELEFYVTADVTQLEIGFYFLDKGKAWFDDVSIEAVPDVDKGASKIAENYVGEVYKILKKQCWYSDSVNLDQIYKNALPLAADAKNTSDCFEAVAYMLDRLGDPSARFHDPSTAKNWLKEQKINDEQPLYPTVKMMEGKFVYILLPGMTAMSKMVLKKYADTLHQQLAALPQKEIKGWVVDLRENVGGNATAMLAAIGPLLTKTVSGMYIRRKKEEIAWTYKNGKATIDTTVIQVTSPYQPAIKDLPVAILTGVETYGAGELIVVAFKSREKSRSFGERTAGFTVNEKRIVLSDGSMLFFTGGMMANTYRIRYSNKIVADVPTRSVFKTDHALGKAIKWLGEQP